MKTSWYPFNGNYTDEKASYIIEGFFNIIPKDVENFVGPEFEILIVLYNVINESNQSKIFKHQQCIYILVKGDESSLGDIVNQRPEPFHNEFYDALTQMVINEYNNVHKSN